MTGKKWKKLLIIWLVGCIVGTVSLTGCGQAGQEVMDEEGIQNFLDSLESYETQAAITFHSNKNEDTYLVLQQVCKDGRYRMEILEPAEFSGVTTLSDGQTVVQTDPSIQGMIKAKNTPVREALFLHTFINRYREAKQEFNLNADGKAVMKAGFSGEMDKISSGVLTFNTAAKQPETLEILDRNGNVSIRIEYKSFEANKALDSGLFNITPQKESQDSNS